METEAETESLTVDTLWLLQMPVDTGHWEAMQALHTAGRDAMTEVASPVASEFLPWQEAGRSQELVMGL